MQWVSVKERYPECGMNKDENMGWLVYRPRASSKKLMTIFVHPDWWKEDDGTSAEITHWRPLPEPPEESNNVINPTKQ